MGQDRVLMQDDPAFRSIGDARPAAWVIADEVGVRMELAAAAHAAGIRVRAEATIAEAAAGLDRQLGTSLTLLELGEDAVAGETTLLAHLDAFAHDAIAPLVVGFPDRAIDRVAGHIAAPYATLLCNATQADRLAAIGLAGVAPLGMASEAGSATEAMRLQALADEVGRIAKALAALSGAGGGDAPRETVSDGLIGYRAQPVVPRPEPEAIRAEDVRAIIRLRRQRDALFPVDLFADPAWDIMLDLMAARIERLKVAVSSLCIAAAVPPTTALRWIRTMTDLGILRRVADPTDGRRVFIELSDSAAKGVLTFLGEAKRAGVVAV